MQTGRMVGASLGALDPLSEWEMLWAPYDEATYAAALAAVEPDDVVLDIGAGDLRLARRMAERARQVIAWEIQPELLAVAAVHGTAASRTDNDSSSRIRDPAAWAVHPRWITDPTGAERASSLEADERLIVVCTDARTAPIPLGLTVAVLLMRHCTHYALYTEMLRAAGCRRLVTNARWGMGVEVIDLGPAAPFDSLGVGWYACRRCGVVGWTGNDAAAVTEAVIEHVTDVEGCPACTR
ncbi:MAG TPA: rRNA adenine N-6-methyltransferase family protein [Anaerolineae bacterium]|nr:rRNA adenine N-6-methyltransferase family protein [Anaerolineae bacterium]